MNVARPRIEALFSLWHFTKEILRLTILSELIREPSWFSKQIARFPKWDRLVGDNLGKMVKNCVKITKSAFWGQNRKGKEMEGIS